MSVLPREYAPYKLPAVTAVILFLMALNLRGVKESVKVLMPIFLVFLLAHAILIVGGILGHLGEAAVVAEEVKQGYAHDMSTIGFAAMFAIFIRAYTMGAGTYTGIEAVSNGLAIMREPKVETGRRTMLYMAISLSVTAGGILLCYLLYHVTPIEGKTMNAALLDSFAGNWQIGDFEAGKWFVIVALGSEALLLFVAAQAGFIDGPRVMANMANDSWMPHQFNALSDRLTTRNGIVLMSLASILTLYYTNGDTRTLVLMYSINVFLTFSLSESGMVRYWILHRKKYPKWYRSITIHIIGLILCLSILVVNIFEKFTEGGWITLLITSALIALCLWIKRHYKTVHGHMARLDSILDEIPMEGKPVTKPLDRSAPTAVLLVNTYGGLGIHTLLNIRKLFPEHFYNLIPVSVGVVDSVQLKGVEEVDEITHRTEEVLQKYQLLASRLGFASEYRMAIGTDPIEESERICRELNREYSNAIFFASKLVFQNEKWYQRLLHNQTPNRIQRQLQFNGMNCMVMPVRVFE